MPGRRKFGHFQFMSESVKKPIIERRKATLFKKAEELSVLCDAKVGLVLFSPSESAPIVWPSRDVAETRFLKFMDIPESERMKKMVVHERYLMDSVNGEIEKMRKKEDEVDRKEMNLLMNQVIHGKSLMEMDARQLRGLFALAGEKMKDLEKRKKELQLLNDGGEVGGARLHHRAEPDSGLGVTAGGYYYLPQQPAPLFDASWQTVDNVVVPPSSATAGEFTSLDSASWLIPTMAAPPALGGGGVGAYPDMTFSAAAAAAAAAGGSSSTNNGGGNPAAASSSSNPGVHQLASWNQAWQPYSFFPPSF